MNHFKPLQLMLIIGALALVIIGIPRQATAQDTAKTVDYDTPVSGQITDAASQESWTLTAPASDRFAISVERTDGTLVPKVEVYDATKTLLAKADHDNSYAQASIKLIKLTSAGTYTITVGRYQEQAGKTSGKYQLTLTLLGAGLERPELSKVVFKPIQPDQPYESELTNVKWMDSWRLHTHGKDHVLLSVMRLSGNLIPAFVVFDPNGQEVGRAAPVPEADRAELALSLDYGDYEIRIARSGDADGVTTGKYRITMTVLGVSESDEALQIISGELKPDTPREGSLVNRRWKDQWGIIAKGPEVVTITAQRKSGTLIPTVSLTDVKGKVLVTGQPDDTFTGSTISNFALPTAGQYIVVIARMDGIAGGTTGEYELKFTPSTTP